MAETILVVDDSRIDTAYLTNTLNEYIVVSAASGAEMWQVLEKGSPSIILMDVVLPGDDGFQIAKKLSGIDRFADIPVIFITSRDTGRDVEQGFESGGVDYIKKPYNEIELRARIKSALRNKRQERELREKTITDPLTGMYNRRYFFDYLEKIIEHTRRNPAHGFSIALMDLDHFKAINDALGHQAGDFVLVQLGEFLKKSIRPYDLLARYGGEEFIILFKDCNKNEAGEILRRIKEAVSRTEYRFNEMPVHITFSSGISDLNDTRSETVTVEELVKIADGRLYRAKEAGRNRIVVDSGA